MADECCDISNIVTTFLLRTCRLLPPLSHRDVEAASHCAVLAGQHPEGNEGAFAADDHPLDMEAELIPLTTGSVAEFYIEPMLPRVGDIDVMYHLSIEMAIPRGHPQPTQLNQLSSTTVSG